MFRNLLPRLFGDDHRQDNPLSADDAEVAVAALLVRIARADRHYRESERQRIDLILARRRSLIPSEAAERRAAAEMLEAEAPDTVRFTRAIKDRIPLDYRVSVISALWDIALSDGDRSPEEDAAIRLTCGLLGVSDKDSARARQAIERAHAAGHRGVPAAVSG